MMQQKNCDKCFYDGYLCNFPQVAIRCRVLRSINHHLNLYYCILDPQPEAEKVNVFSCRLTLKLKFCTTEILLPFIVYFSISTCITMQLRSYR